MKFFSKNKEPDDLYLTEEIELIPQKSPAPENPNVLTVDELLGRHTHRAENAKSTGALDSLKKRMLNANGKIEVEPEIEKTVEPKIEVKEGTNTVAKPITTNKDDGKTLLEKCRPYILDEKGKDTSKDIPPAYKLESVADILRKDNDSAVDSFNQKYDFEADYLGKYVEKKLAEEKAAEKAKLTPPKSSATTETISISAIKNAQTNVAFTISDIDPLEKTTVMEPIKENSGATITFTPVTSGDTAPVIMVSSKTQQLDLTGEMAIMEDISSSSPKSRVELEKSDFEDFVPPSEIKSDIDSKRFVRSFSIKKRNYFLAAAISVLFAFLLLIIKMPFMTGAVLSQTKTTMIVCTVFLGIIAAINGDMFLSLANLFKKRSDADVLAALSTLFVLGYSIFGIINGEIITDLCLLCGASLTVRAIGKFQKYSYLLSNLKQITKKSPKKAVRLLNDPTITYAMAKNSIEGDTLIATPQQTERIDDYIKYSTYGTFLNGKLPIIIIVSLLLSALTLLAATKNFGNIFDGMYAAAAVQCFASMPAVFLIDNLPLYKAAKKLNRQGAMISGKAGAEHIELANAIVLNSDDLFPAGTVTLHDMRVLSENNMSDTILRAASLTRELSSPLFNVFREIAGDENMQNLPTSDTVKYEERMGISGWVDNQLLFIGNRTIMEAHGITVPDIETDRKVLRSGYFPVYVASNDTAVALLMVQYSVSPTVSKELHNLTKIGVTLLINNTDPNLSNEMICDYLGLYEDSVMVMSAAGCNMYKNTSTPVESCSTPAVFRGKPITLAKILNCANRIRRSNTALTVMYVLTAVLGILTFAYTSFAANDTLMGGATILLYAVASTILTLITYLTQKP